MVIKPRAGILPIVFHCWIALSILSMSSVWQEEVNKVFVHFECECTCCRYSKKKQQQQQSNKQHSVKLTMNVVTEITVPGFLLQRSSTRFPNVEKKTLKHQMEHKHL